MPTGMTVLFDTIGYWSEIKLEIIREYALEYSKILAGQRNPELHHVYIDAFAGSGKHISRTKKDFVKPECDITDSCSTRKLNIILFIRTLRGTIDYHDMRLQVGLIV